MTFPKDKIEIFLDGLEQRQNAIYNDKNGNFLQLPIYTPEDTQITGKVKINLENKTVKHLGIFVQLIGEAETYHSLDKPEVFLYQSQEVEFPGKLKGEKVYSFLFSHFDAKCETYYGMGGKIRYYLRAIIAKKVGSPISKQSEFAVQLPIQGMLLNQGFDIQLRIADYLMISVDLNRMNYHIDECIMGKITIEQIKLAVKRIQLALIKREILNPTTTGSYTKENIITKVELDNKYPKKGDLIPFKIHLSPLNLSPTMAITSSKIVTKYVMVLSFIDEDDRSLFKPLEINTWRKK